MSTGDRLIDKCKLKHEKKIRKKHLKDVVARVAGAEIDTIRCNVL